MTEDYPVLLNGQGMPEVEETGKLKCLFVGIPFRDITSGQLHLVCRITRKVIQKEKIHTKNITAIISTQHQLPQWNEQKITHIEHPFLTP